MSLLPGVLRFRFRSFGSFGFGFGFRFRAAELPCQQVVEMVTDYLEGALSAGDRRRLEAHLAGCPHCTEYLAQIRETIRLAGRITPEDLTPQMRTELTDLYRRWRTEG